MSAKVGRPWFEPRRFGYGATPVTSQGWTTTAMFVVVVVLDVLRLRGILRSAELFLGAAHTWTACLKSSDSWRWR